MTNQIPYVFLQLFILQTVPSDCHQAKEVTAPYAFILLVFIIQILLISMKRCTIQVITTTHRCNLPKGCSDKRFNRYSVELMLTQEQYLVVMNLIMRLIKNSSIIEK